MVTMLMILVFFFFFWSFYNLLYRIRAIRKNLLRLNASCPIPLNSVSLSLLVFPRPDEVLHMAISGKFPSCLPLQVGYSEAKCLGANSIIFKIQVVS